MVTVPVPPDRLLALEAENAELRSRLQVIEKRDSELMKANDALKRSLTALTTANSLQFFLQTVLQQTIYASGAVSGAVFVYNSSSHTLDLAEIVLHGEILNVQTDPRAELLRGVPADISGLWEQMSQNEKIFWFEIEKAPTEHWGFTDSWDTEMGHRMLATIPLKVGKQVLGYLGLAFADVQPPTEIKLEQANALTQQIALALQISRLSEEAQKAAVAKLNEVVAREREQAAQERAAELATINEALIQRDRLLAVVAQVTQDLLENPNVEQAIAQALQKLGEASGASRMTLFHEKPEPQTGRLQHHILLEWTLSNVPRLMDNPDTCSLYSDDYPDIAAELHTGRSTSLHLKDYSPPAPAFWAKFGVHSRSIVPILIEGEYFGCVCFDDCFQYHPWSEQEMDILTAGAGAIGAALLRQRLTEKAKQSAIVQEQERAAQTRVIELATMNAALSQRDCLLSALAQVTHNLLENPNVHQAIDQALQQLGQTAGSDRLNLLEERLDVDTGQLKHYVIAEWAAPDIPRQIDDPDTCIINNRDLPEIFADLHAGRSLALYLEDYPEPIQPYLANIAIKASGVMPIFIGDEYYGCLCFDNCLERRLWSEQEMDVLTTAAGAIGAAILRQRLVDRLIQSHAEQERATELIRANEALKRSVSHLTSANSLQLFLDAILQESIQVCGVASAVVFIYNQACQTVELQALMILGEAIPVATDPRAAVYRSAKEANGLPLLDNCDPKITWLEIDDPLVEYWTGGRAWHQQYGHQLLNIVPCCIGTQLLGYLGMAFTSSQKPSPTQIEQSWTLAQHVTLALQLARLAEEGKQAAIFAERNRIASDIHDTLAQAFTGISLQLEVAKPLIHQEPVIVEQILHHISQLAKNGLDEARRSVWALYPPGAEYANLAQMLYDSVEQMSRNTPISLEVNIVGDPCSLSPYLGMNLLRIGQEALTNALKHSQAQTVLIELTYTTDSVSLLIRDDGRGFVPPTNPDSFNGGFGLVGMYERCDRLGALLSIVSQPGQGTQILVQSPLS